MIITALLATTLGCVPITSSADPPAARNCPFILFEQDSEVGQPASGLPILRRIARDDKRWSQVHEYANNEAARFAFLLIAEAWRIAGRGGPAPPLAILLVRGGNSAERGYRIREGGRIAEAPESPYVALDLQPARFRLTLLHEAGHVAHDIVGRVNHPHGGWSAGPHSTFAVTDPVTALYEGYAIQLETLWAVYGSDPEQHAFYERSDQRLDTPGTSAAFYFPANDLLNFSQTWARYSGVRDGDAAFEGFVYPEDYLRSRYDPARDRASLRRPNALISSEGVVASVLFRTAATIAKQGAALPGRGLAQRGVVHASSVLLRALRDARIDSGSYRPDLIDVVNSFRNRRSVEQHIALSRLIDVTRGTTARPELRRSWASFYQAALSVDPERSLEALRTLEPARRDILRDAELDPATLRRGIGPVLPVRLQGKEFFIVGLREAFPVQFDLNALSRADIAMLRNADQSVGDRLDAELDRKPFASIRDFEERTGMALARFGLTAVDSAPHL